MAEVITGEVGEQNYPDNTTSNRGFRMGRQGDLVNSQLHGRYTEQSLRGRLYTAHAIITAPVIYTTAAGTGGPLLWNGSTTHKASLIAVGWGLTVTTTVVAILGLTGNSGQSSAPSSTTAIDSVKNCYMGGQPPACTAYRVGTVAAAGNFFHPLGDVLTGAITTRIGSFNWVDVGGAFTIPPQGWLSIAASATATTLAGNFGIMWEEIPV